MTIQSNKETAAEVATNIAVSSTAISSQAMIALDGSSSFTANGNVSSSTSGENGKATELSNSTIKFVDLIHGVADEFEADDQKISAAISQQIINDTPSLEDAAKMNGTSNQGSVNTNTQSMFEDKNSGGNNGKGK